MCTLRNASWSVIAACNILFAAGQVPAVNSPQRQCHRVTAKLMTVKTTDKCPSPVNFCAAGVVLADGLLNGTTTAVVLGLAPSVGLPGVEPATTASYAGERTITTHQGVLTLRFTGVFDTARGEFSELERVQDGTGKFSGATGTLFVFGTSSADGTSFQAQIQGEICTAKRGDDR